MSLSVQSQKNITSNHTDINILSSCKTQKSLSDVFNTISNVRFAQSPTFDVSTDDSTDYNDNMITWMSDKADLMLIVWDGNFHGSIESELLKISKQTKIPCIWISAASPEKVYWSLNSYYDEFSQNKLENYLSSVFYKETEDLNEHKVPLIKLGVKLYGRFNKKLKAKAKFTPYLEDDEVISKECYFEDETAEALRKKLVNYFNKYDSIAIDHGEKYRTTIYLRSILPFIATVVLAIGFYIETIVGKPLNYLLNMPVEIWTAIAGIGFLLHAGVNLYSYLLSQNKQVRKWHSNFISNRCMAEITRLMTHFIPFGLSMNVKNVLDKCSGTSEQKHIFYVQTRAMLSENENYAVPYNEQNSRKALESLLQLVKNQRTYHQNCVDRYDFIVKHLLKMERIIFKFGFVLVILRGILQLMLCVPAINGSLNSVLGDYVADPTAYTRSFLNMFALVVPALASYFASKLSLCGFSELHRESVYMLEKLDEIENIVITVQQRDHLPFELMHTISNDICTIFLDDFIAWNGSINAKTVSHI